MASDPWYKLKQYTNARIAMGRSGGSIPTNEVLKFRMAHSIAKDAINSVIDIPLLSNNLEQIGLSSISVHSKVTDRTDYLLNPDKGKVLNNNSIIQLQKIAVKPVDLCIVIADGLSANAINFHSTNVIALLLPLLNGWRLSPIILAQQSRVALADPIGEILKARITLILIGERPGLSSPNSMGAYLTYQPLTGTTDEKRNCISNIQPEGLPYEAAALKLSYLLHQMKTKQISGVELKDDFNNSTRIN